MLLAHNKNDQYVALIYIYALTDPYIILYDSYSLCFLFSFSDYWTVEHSFIEFLTYHNNNNNNSTVDSERGRTKV